MRLFTRTWRFRSLARTSSNCNEKIQHFQTCRTLKIHPDTKKMFSIEIMLSIRKLFRTFSSQLIAKQGCSASNHFCRQRKFTTIFITKWLVKSFYNSFLEMLELTSVRTFRYWSFLFWMILWWSHISFSNVLIKSFNILISFASLKFTPPSASCLYSLNSASSSSFSFNSRS